MFLPKFIKEIRLSKFALHSMPDRIDGPEVFWLVNKGNPLTQKQFARLIGWGEATVARWESGAEKPNRANELILDAWYHSSQFRYLVCSRYQEHLEEQNKSKKSE
jgi:hypothetical protein